MSVYERYEELSSTFGSIVCVCKDTKEIFMDVSELPVDLAGKDESEAVFKKIV